jgi:hypothetical protein
MGHYFQSILSAKGVRLVDTHMWHKGLNWTNNPQTSFHDKLQHTTYRILNNTEQIFVFQKDGNRQVAQEIEKVSRISKEEYYALADSVWKIAPVKNQKDHPAQFPEELPRRLIKIFSYKGDIVLDPFLGSGTTNKVARDLERVGIGYEKDLKYRPVIMKKLRIIEDQLAVPENRKPDTDLNKEETRGAISKRLRHVLPAVVAETTNRDESISRLAIPLKPSLSKKDILIETVPLNDGASPIWPAPSGEFRKSDDYEEKDNEIEPASIVIAKAA